MNPSTLFMSGIALASGVFMAWQLPSAVEALRARRHTHANHERAVALVDELQTLRSAAHTPTTAPPPVSGVVGPLSESAREAGGVTIAGLEPMGDVGVVAVGQVAAERQARRHAVRVRLRASDLASLGRFLSAWNERRTGWQPTAISLTMVRGVPAQVSGAADVESSVNADIVLAATFIGDQTNATR